jgi:peptidoglycan/LPS O-acetylase OafA/YrhL
MNRIHWLDGVRALAALFVVLHHLYLSVFPGFPESSGPAYLGVLLYGHFPVVVFIVVSGFSIGLGVMKRPLDAAAFYQRRAWRILPPYWIALAASIAVTATVSPAGGAGFGWTAFVYGALLQDLIPSRVPNGAFWSIAVEAQIYVVFPLLILTATRLSIAVMAAAVTALVIALNLLSPHFHFLRHVDHMSPALLAGFLCGLLAAQEVVRGHSRLPMRMIAAVGAACIVALCAYAGIGKVVSWFFWIDMLVAAVTAMAFVGLSRNPGVIGRALSWGPLERAGEFSYSTYLIHGPVMLAIFSIRLCGILPVLPRVRAAVPVGSDVARSAVAGTATIDRSDQKRPSTGGRSGAGSTVAVTAGPRERYGA